MRKSYSKIRHIQEANQKLEKRMLTEKRILKEEIDFSKIYDALTTCATQYKIQIPQACSSLKNPDMGGDRNPNALANCIKEIVKIGNMSFLGCVKDKSGIDITSSDIMKTVEKGIEDLKKLFGGSKTPWDEKLPNF